MVTFECEQWLFLDELKTLYVRFLDSFQTEEFVHTLQRRDRTVENHITDEGVAIFKDAMRQHGVDMEKPKSTLEKAKRLLQRYNHVVELADTLETEMALLESDSKDMIADYSVMKGGGAPKQEPDEHAQISSTAPQAPLQVRLDPTTAIPPATPSAASVHSIRTVIPSQMPSANVANVGLDQMLLTSLAENFSQQNFSNNLLQNLQAIANLNQPLTAQASTTNFNNYSHLSSDLLNIINSGKLDGLTERVNGSNFPLFNGSNNSLPSATPNSTVPVPVSVTIQQPSTSVSSTTAGDVNGAAPKKARARTVRAPSNKKNSMTKESEDPARKEEIDKKIMVSPGVLGNPVNDGFRTLFKSLWRWINRPRAKRKRTEKQEIQRRGRRRITQAEYQILRLPMEPSPGRRGRPQKRVCLNQLKPSS